MTDDLIPAVIIVEAGVLDLNIGLHDIQMDVTGEGSSWCWGGGLNLRCMPVMPGQDMLPSLLSRA